MSLFESPIKTGKIRDGVCYYQYRSGVILIDKTKFVGYTIKQAVAKWRSENK